jgi:hypothetical protein
MPFEITSQDMGSYIEDIINELTNEFAVDGVEINYEKKSDRFTKMSIKYIDEEGVLEIRRRNNDIVFSYDIERERKEIKKGIMGAVSGAGLGSLIRGAFRGSRNFGDQVAGAVGGAVAGGSYKAYEGYEESKKDRTKFAKLLAKTVEEVLGEIQGKINTDKQNISETSKEIEKVEDLLEELSLSILSMNEEIVFLDPETESIDRIKARITRAEQLFKEAKQELTNENLSEARVKAKVAQNMVKKAQTLMSK